MCVCGGVGGPGSWRVGGPGSLEPISQPPLPSSTAHFSTCLVSCHRPAPPLTCLYLAETLREKDGLRLPEQPVRERRSHRCKGGGGCSEPEKSQSHCLLLVPGLPVSPWGDESSPWCGQGLLPITGGVLGTGVLVREANKQTCSRLDRGGSLELEAVLGCGENSPVVSSQVPCIC